MRAAIRLSAGILVLAVAVAPGFAKKTRPTPCSGRFLLDSGESLVTEAASTGTDALSLAGRQVTIGGSCTATGSLGRTRTGCPAGQRHGCWRLRARWSSCGNLSKPTLAATISFDCQKLTGTLRAKHQPRRRFTASLSGCDTGAVAYAGTWEAIQNTIFVRHDCANDLCHGSAKQGGLDLRTDVAYANMIQVPSMEVRYNLVPEDLTAFQKYLAADPAEDAASRKWLWGFYALLAVGLALILLDHPQHGRARGAPTVDLRDRPRDGHRAGDRDRAERLPAPRGADHGHPARPARPRHGPPVHLAAVEARGAQPARALLRDLLRFHRQGAGGIQDTGAQRRERLLRPQRVLRLERTDPTPGSSEPPPHPQSLRRLRRPDPRPVLRRVDLRRWGAGRPDMRADRSHVVRQRHLPERSARDVRLHRLWPLRSRRTLQLFRDRGGAEGRVPDRLRPGRLGADAAAGHPLLESACLQPDGSGYDDARVAELLFRHRPAISPAWHLRHLGHLRRHGHPALPDPDHLPGLHLRKRRLRGLQEPAAGSALQPLLAHAPTRAALLGHRPAARRPAPIRELRLQ